MITNDHKLRFTRTEQPSLVRLRPRSDTLFVSQSRTVMATGRDGQIPKGSRHGLFAYETRVLSQYEYRVEGEPLLAVALSNLEPHTWLGYYVILPPDNPRERPDRGSGYVQEFTQETLELRVWRWVGAGMQEELQFTNYTQLPTRFQFTIRLDADFAGQAEIEIEGHRKLHLKREWRQRGPKEWELGFHSRSKKRYDHQGERGVAHLYRGLYVRILDAQSEPEYARGALRFQIELAPRAQWHAYLEFVPHLEGEELPAIHGYGTLAEALAGFEERRSIFFSDATRFEAGAGTDISPVVTRALEQSISDLASLRLYDLDVGQHAWTMAAGLPVYIALFGRDTLTASWQAALASSDMIQGTLPELAKWQGRANDPWRDEQPGRMLHEAHTGPDEVLNINPRGRYYGAITTSAFYPVVVSELWHWTGNKELVRPLVDPALKALGWLDNYAHLTGDRFYDYRTQSKAGTKHQAWKDSGDAIVYPDGRQVEPPIATCEEQAFVYAAKLHLSELLWWLDDKETAKRLYQQAEELKKVFNEVFWMESEHFFAMGLDSANKQIQSVGSNPGHCIAAGIVDESVVRETADRLLAPDLFTGWGVRTLSCDHPAYNPYSYHRGSVWPVEHGTFALGLVRYGLHDHAERICRGMFEAATLFEYFRLPELFAGHPRDARHPFPGLYPRANWPQAWSSAAVIQLVQALLGIYPYAPLHMLMVDPHLPEWLPEITLRGLRVGEAAIDLHFWRRPDGSSDYRILETRGTLHVLRQPSPWSLTATFGERFKDAVLSLLPGK